MENGVNPRLIVNLDEQTGSLAVTHDGLIAVAAPQRLVLFNSNVRQVMQDIPATPHIIPCLSSSPFMPMAFQTLGSQNILAIGAGSRLSLLYLNDCVLRDMPGKQPSTIAALAWHKFIPSLIATTGQGGSLVMRDIRQKTCEYSVAEWTGSIPSIGFNDIDPNLMVSAQHRYAIIWDIRKSHEILTELRHDSNVLQVEWAGRHLLTRSLQGGVRVWQDVSKDAAENEKYAYCTISGLEKAFLSCSEAPEVVTMTKSHVQIHDAELLSTRLDIQPSIDTKPAPFRDKRYHHENDCIAVAQSSSDLVILSRDGHISFHNTFDKKSVPRAISFKDNDSASIISNTSVSLPDLPESAIDSLTQPLAWSQRCTIATVNTDPTKSSAHSRQSSVKSSHRNNHPLARLSAATFGPDNKLIYFSEAPGGIFMQSHGAKSFLLSSHRDATISLGDDTMFTQEAFAGAIRSLVHMTRAQNMTTLSDPTRQQSSIDASRYRVTIESVKHLEPRANPIDLAIARWHGTTNLCVRENLRYALEQCNVQQSVFWQILLHMCEDGWGVSNLDLTSLSKLMLGPLIAGYSLHSNLQIMATILDVVRPSKSQGMVKPPPEGRTLTNVTSTSGDQTHSPHHENQAPPHTSTPRMTSVNANRIFISPKTPANARVMKSVDTLSPYTNESTFSPASTSGRYHGSYEGRSLLSRTHTLSQWMASSSTLQSPSSTTNSTRLSPSRDPKGVEVLITDQTYKRRRVHGRWRYEPVSAMPKDVSQKFIVKQKRNSKARPVLAHLVNDCLGVQIRDAVLTAYTEQLSRLNNNKGAAEMRKTLYAYRTVLDQAEYHRTEPMVSRPDSEPISCIICELHITGQALICAQCLHVTHEHCWQRWTQAIQDEVTCPAGCECQCR